MIAEARTWIDTPVRTGGRKKGVEIDCVGLIVKVGVNSKMMDEPDLAVLANGGNYGLLPNPKHMQEALERFLKPITKEKLLPGDVILFELSRGSGGMHLGILTFFDGRLAVIHADARRKRVVEITYSGTFPRLTLSHWRYPKF